MDFFTRAERCVCIIAMEFRQCHLCASFICKHGLWTSRKKAFFRKSQTSGLGQANLGYFGRFFSTHFGTLMFPLLNHYLYKKLGLYIQITKIYLGVAVEFRPERIRNLIIVCPLSVSVKTQRTDAW